MREIRQFYYCHFMKMAEFKDFVPTLVYLRDNSILTVVTNYWYEPLSSLPRFFGSHTVENRQNFWHPAGNQNEMFMNDLAVSSLGVHWLHKFKRNPFPMLFHPLPAPGATAPEDKYQPMKNGYYHIFKGATTDPAGAVRAKQKQFSRTLACHLQHASLGVMAKHPRAEPVASQIEAVRSKFLVASPDSDTWWSASESACKDMDKAVTTMMTDFKKDSAFRLAEMEQNLGTYEAQQEEQEEFFKGKCDRPDNGKVENREGGREGADGEREEEDGSEEPEDENDGDEL